MQHNPSKFAMGVSAKLAARSRHVCTFFGAGISAACGLPDVAKLQAKVQADLGAGDKALFEKQLAGGRIWTSPKQIKAHSRAAHRQRHVGWSHR